MDLNSPEDLLRALLSTSSAAEVNTLLEAAGDHPGLVVGERFGKLGLTWKYYGGTESNISTINLATRAERSLIERVTNAIDGVLEREHSRRTRSVPGQKQERSPESPMQAAERWFGRPPTSVDSGIFTWSDLDSSQADEQVHVVLSEGDEDTKPTIDVIDNGQGLQPEQFARTILSLQGGNKIQKKYLAGAYGQGGSSTLAFCDYTLIVSRHVDTDHIVGFTVMKLMELPEEYKENAYVYLSVDASAQDTVPSIRLNGNLFPYAHIPGTATNSPIRLPYGTLVRSYGFRLERHSGRLGANPGNLYHLLHNMLFDPILPFRVVDYRRSGRFQNRLVTGARNRLMSRMTDPQAGRTEVVHYAPLELVSALADSEPSIGIEYWVVFSRRKTASGERLQTYSNSRFVIQDRPIVGTLNGQNQGELTTLLVRRLGLGMVARHLIVNIDASQATKRERNELFSTTREGFRDDRALERINTYLTERMRNDPVLYRLESELIESQLLKDSSAGDQEVKSEITKLLRDTGYRIRDSGWTGAVAVMPAGGLEPGAAEPKVVEALATLPYPWVTKLEIAAPSNQLRVPVGGQQLIKIETDGDFQLDEDGRFTIECEPAFLEVASKSFLRAGRMNWRLRTVDGASEGQRGQVTVRLTKFGGELIERQIPFEIAKPPEPSVATRKGDVPIFDIVGVDPAVQADLFRTIWPDVETGEIDKIAFRAMEVQGELRVYYSKGFRPYRLQMDQTKSHESLAELFERNYKIWIGYHAIMQYKNKGDHQLNLEEEMIDLIRESERTLAAEIQVKQAISSAKLQMEAVRQN
jgi:hypothetical protein